MDDRVVNIRYAPSVRAHIAERLEDFLRQEHQADYAVTPFIVDPRDYNMVLGEEYKGKLLYEKKT